MECGQGFSSTQTHRWVPATAGQPVPTAQSPTYCMQCFFHLFNLKNAVIKKKTKISPMVL